MNSLTLDFMSKGKIPRDEIKQLLFASIQAEAFSFSRRLSALWLEKYPGDLEMQYIHARVLASEGETEEAVNVLSLICNTDPEFIEAQEFLLRLSPENTTNSALDALACVYAMGRSVYTDFQIPEWSFIFRTAWQAYLAGQLENAERLITQVLVQKPNLTLAAILHQRIVLARGDQIAHQHLTSIYLNRFPDCLNFILLHADQLMENGAEMEAIELLHDCVARDSIGIVATRIWGDHHRYQSLWVEHLEADFNLPIPVEVSSFLGLNNLPEGERVSTGKRFPKEGPPELFVDHFSHETESEEGGVSRTQRVSIFDNVHSDNETIAMVDEIFEKMSKKLKQPDLKRTDGRYPVYVILSLKKKITEKYGRQTFLVLDTEMRQLSSTVKSKMGWDSVVFYPDDSANMVSYGLAVVEGDVADPWKIKKALVDLDQALAKKGEMIGALLIVGGPDIVPYHRLPNPTDDMDDAVASDNPYGAMDGNYFVQEWSVGRMTGDRGNDAGLLLSQIRAAISRHQTKQEAQSIWQRILNLMQIFQSSIRTMTKKSGKGGSAFGYSAAIWQNASQAAFRTIGNGQKLFISPPEKSGSIHPGKLTTAKFNYFNLHGLDDSPEWYGQRIPGDTESQSDYPVALSPAELSKNGAAPEIVFSEACYGALIEGKLENESIALKYLGLGTSVFIGSTCISYGSIDTPLIGADLLANLFWKNLLNSTTVGEAFSKAKLELAKEMDKRQGFLDGEDQKTLLSFILLGDPLTSVNVVGVTNKRIMKRLPVPSVAYLSDNEDLASQNARVSPGILHEVKRIAEVYLPGLEEVDIHVCPQDLVSTVGFDNQADNQVNPRRKSVRKSASGHYVVTVSKAVPVSKKIHHHYMRARIGSDGTVEKVTVSR